MACDGLLRSGDCLDKSPVAGQRRMIFRSGRTPSRLKRIEFGQRLVETPLRLGKAQEADALDKYLSWRGLPGEQRHHLVGELVKRQIARAALLTPGKPVLH